MSNNLQTGRKMFFLPFLTYVQKYVTLNTPVAATNLNMLLSEHKVIHAFYYNLQENKVVVLVVELPHHSTLCKASISYQLLIPRNHAIWQQNQHNNAATYTAEVL